jgi:hypothetical protein
VETCAEPEHGALCVSIISPLVRQGKLGVHLAFPYGDAGGAGGVWNKPEAHTTTVLSNKS